MNISNKIIAILNEINKNGFDGWFDNLKAKHKALIVICFGVCVISAFIMIITIFIICFKISWILGLILSTCVGLIIIYVLLYASFKSEEKDKKRFY